MVLPTSYCRHKLLRKFFLHRPFHYYETVKSIIESSYSIELIMKFSHSHTVAKTVRHCLQNLCCKKNFILIEFRWSPLVHDNITEENFDTSLV